MRKLTSLTVALVAATILSTAASAQAALPQPEEFQYSWRLKGALSWLASLRFPTSGVGELKTIPLPESGSIQTQLLITTPAGREGFYVYRSEIDPATNTTLISYTGYEWGEKKKNEQTLFDYVKRLLRIRKQDAGEVENEVRPLPGNGRSMKDVLTGIYYLRQNADTLKAPVRSDIFSDGKIYSVVFTPGPSSVLDFNGQKIASRVFVITAAPGQARKFPGSVKVWLSTDSRHIPLRIEVQRSLAALQLDLVAIR